MLTLIEINEDCKFAILHYVSTKDIKPNTRIFIKELAEFNSDFSPKMLEETACWLIENEFLTGKHRATKLIYVSGITTKGLYYIN